MGTLRQHRKATVAVAVAAAVVLAVIVYRRHQAAASASAAGLQAAPLEPMFGPFGAAVQAPSYGYDTSTGAYAALPATGTTPPPGTTTTTPTGSSSSTGPRGDFNSATGHPVGWPGGVTVIPK